MTSTAVSPSTPVGVLANHVGGAWTPSSATDTLEGVATGVDVELVRQPVGVVAAITPFNFPAATPRPTCARS
jgi:acyl-CoA reductase-like NAD-dependent aldehyde dehydrogenase